ncbi:hypothetical protein ACFDTO_16355 [Microbacteriaceae bacterium 4G12]
MKKITFGILIVFLAFIGVAYAEKKGLFQSSSVHSTMKSETKVVWKLSDVALHKQASITFTLQDENGKELRRLDEGLQSQIHVFITNSSLSEYKDIKPNFLGNGTFSFSYTFSKEENYTIFLYRQNEQQQEQFAAKEIVLSNEGVKKASKLIPDSLLTTKIDSYEMSLVFNMLKPNQQESLQFQFQNKEGQSIRFQSSAQERNHLIIIDENRKHLIYLPPANEKRKNELTFPVEFPEEGMYKLYGTFYLDRQKYERNFVINVGKKK